MRLLAVLLALLCSFPALAGVTLVPTPPLLADGATVATVRLFVDGAQSPRPKIKSDDGKVGPVVGAPDGTVTFPFTPERASAPGVAKLVVSWNGEDVTVDVPVVPAFGGGVTVAFDPPVLAANGTATVRLTPSLPGPVAAEQRRFLVAVSAGTVDVPVPAGNGTWVARYTPPKGLTTPTQVVVSAADASAPDAVGGHAVLPVTVRRSLSYDGPVGGNAILQVGDRSYGPFPVAPTGKVAFDVDVDPRFPKGNLTLVDGSGARTQREVEIPDTGRAQIGFLSIGPVVPERGSAKVRVVVYAPGGRERTDAALKLTASSGTVSEPKYTNGAYEAVFSASGGAGDVTLVAEADGARAERKVKVVPGAGSITLTSDPAEIATTGTSVKLTARVKDAGGTAVTGKVPTFSVLAGGSLSGTPKDNGDGSYTATVKITSGANLLRVAASPQLAASGAAPARLVAWLSSPVVAADGAGTLTLNVVALDPYGLPVPNVELTLGVPRGDGSLPPRYTIPQSGIARATYKAGTTAGLGAIRVEGAGLYTEVPVFQARDGVAPALPVAGPPDVEAALARWTAAAPELAVVRAGTAPLAGPPASVVISTVPPYTTPGAAILVNVRVLDAAAKGVPAQKLQVTASPGTPGAITDNRDGSYSLPVQLPAGVDGPLTVTVGVGSATGSVVLPTLATAAAAPAPKATGGGGGGAASGATGGGAAKAQKTPVQSDREKLRIGVALVNARGSYSQTGNGGDQLLGMAEFATPGAGFFGLHADLVYWPVDAGWGSLGLDARAHGQLELFNISDNAYVNLQRDVIAAVRYRRSAGALSGGFGLGAHYTTGVVFRYADAALSDARLLNFPLVGARVAASGQLEVGKSYASIEIAETFVPFPVDTHAEAFYEYDFSSIGVRLGVVWDYRTMSFETESGGGDAKVKQNQVSVLAGVGFHF